LNTPQQFRCDVHIVNPHYAFLRFAIAEKVYAPVPYQTLVNNRKFLMNAVFSLNNNALLSEQFPHPPKKTFLLPVATLAMPIISHSCALFKQKNKSEHLTDKIKPVRVRFMNSERAT
jgi:hypothetical protein